MSPGPVILWNETILCGKGLGPSTKVVWGLRVTEIFTIYEDKHTSSAIGGSLNFPSVRGFYRPYIDRVIL